MRAGPLLYQPQSSSRTNSARKDLSIEGERCLLALVLGMKVRDAVLSLEHSDDNAKEHGDDRHGLILLPRSFLVTLDPEGFEQ